MPSPDNFSSIESSENRFLSRQSLPAVWKYITVAIAYFVTAILSDYFTTYPETGSTPIWIAGGVGVGLICIWGGFFMVGFINRHFRGRNIDLSKLARYS